MRIPTYVAVVVMIFLALALVAYLRPSAFSEGFTTIAIESQTIPKCVFRSPEAQQLLSALYTLVKNDAPASPKAMAYQEFKMIIQKVLCIDADITGLGSGPYSTYQLPFETQQDIVPAADFVGRCLRNGVNARDIEVQYAKYIDRGNVLLMTIVTNPVIASQAKQQFTDIARKSAKAISFVCLSGNATLDKPAGPRDPGYYSPPSLKELGPYKIFGGFQYF